MKFLSLSNKFSFICEVHQRGVCMIMACRCPNFDSAWRMMTSSNGNVTGAFPSQRPVTRSLMLPLICTWTNGWANSRDAGDLRRHRAHYAVTVMTYICLLNGSPGARQRLNVDLVTVKFESNSITPFLVHNPVVASCSLDHGNRFISVQWASYQIHKIAKWNPDKFVNPQSLRIGAAR